MVCGAKLYVAKYDKKHKILSETGKGEMIPKMEQNCANFLSAEL